MKKLASALLAVFALAACGGGNSKPSQAQDPVAKATAGTPKCDDVYKVGAIVALRDDSSCVQADGTLAGTGYLDFKCTDASVLLFAGDSTPVFGKVGGTYAVGGSNSLAGQKAYASCLR